MSIPISRNALLSELIECLENHDNGSDWFDGLRGVVGRLREEMSAVSVRD